jgi:hypothetical protein
MERTELRSAAHPRKSLDKRIWLITSSIHEMRMKQDNLQPRELVRAVCMFALLALPVLAMFWIWRDARRVPLGVLGGALFRTPWHIAHAGFSMDQPTIGKWYFWSTVFGGMWILFTFGASRICMSSSQAIRRVYALLTTCGTFLYLLVLTVPFFWTLQYIHTMGLTHRRLIALAWGLVGYIIIVTLPGILVRRVLQSKKDIEPEDDSVSEGTPSETLSS